MTLALTLSLALLCLLNQARRSLLLPSNRPSNILIDEIIDKIPSSTACDSDLCDSIVNKCLMTNRCSCDFKADAPCVKDCVDCLEEKFGKCCPCINGLCPATTNDSHPSHVGSTSASDEQYFQVLTEEDDINGRWHVVTLTRGFELAHPELGQIELAYRRSRHNSNTLSHDSSLAKLNCTVAFINKPLGMARCRKSCTSMGASQFRWFHDGCCECIGQYCFNYGLDESKCKLDDY